MLLLLLTALQASPSPADTVLATARRAVSHLSDTTAARAAGYRPITEMGTPDKVPFQGEHWSLPLRDTTTILERPAFLMFGPVNGEHRRIGVAYSVRLRLEQPAPDGLGGDRAAKWHDHFWCDSIPARPEGFVDDARLPLTRRIERENRNPALADSLQQRRKILSALIPKLKRTEGNHPAYEGVAAEVVTEWEAMLGIYERMASPELRPRVRQRHAAVIAVSAHH